ncbi:MAG: 3-deoxy-8-phosphooctulonate synthase [Alphaproteobacteria bacterium]|nr:3-deoxy-8-phosphooctulonate synthase [Alphaproteobacteria bacterium]NCB49555.1 3-deoxy-8-phosphooctulonate synthase [Alphaproteobacteria bacterium]
MPNVKVQDLLIGNDRPFTLIAGPCQMESRDHSFEMADALVSMTKKLGVPLIFKASFDKANRTSLSGKRGIGLTKALEVFAEIKDKYNIPVITDIHEKEQCAPVAEVVDVLQIPAFLCRQTDLLLAAGKTGKAINVKKGQFLAPWDMKNVADKIASTGNQSILLTERGTSFGYNTLIVDMRSFDEMKKTDYPVIFDATHSVQQPGGLGGSTGGDRRYAPVLANAALTTKIAGLFIETHQDPDHAPSDGPNMIILKELPKILERFVQIDTLIKQAEK